ncbi:TrkA C-terminal domain-containing protein [Deinococcus lacus]|uniref:TrkA C-terminal domain-containing protein n=1 Tax=Deinococcus lacus TaxID=392561 RepID=A0ABW1YAL9_9DEIO
MVGVMRDGQIRLPRPGLRLTRDDELMLLARPDAYRALEALLSLPELR